MVGGSGGGRAGGGGVGDEEARQGWREQLAPLQEDRWVEGLRKFVVNSLLSILEKRFAGSLANTAPLTLCPRQALNMSQIGRQRYIRLAFSVINIVRGHLSFNGSTIHIDPTSRAVQKSANDHTRIV